MTDHVFAAWQQDDETGKNAVMLAQQNVTVTDLNTRAQASSPGRSRDGLAAFQGDRIVTRLNDATLRTGRITLPAEYVQNNVELGYAPTIHRAQGMTEDTAHVLADSSTSRELVYVGLTRGKEANHL